MWLLVYFVAPFAAYMCLSILVKIYCNERRISSRLYANQADENRRNHERMMAKCRRILEDELKREKIERVAPVQQETEELDFASIPPPTTGSSDECVEEANKKHLVSKLKNFFEKNISKLNRAIEPIKIKQKKKRKLSSETTAATAKEHPSSAIRFRSKFGKAKATDDGDDFEDILQAQRFSRRFSQYSISEYLDEKEVKRSVSISELLTDDHEPVEPVHISFDDLELKSSTLIDHQPISFESVVEPTDSGRGSADTFEQIFEEQTFSRGCSQYSISDLLVDDEKCQS